MSGLTVRLYTAEEIHDQHGTTVAETVEDYLANALEWCGLSDAEYTIDIQDEPYPESGSDSVYDFLDWLKSRDAYRDADCSHLLADGGFNHSLGRVSRANAADINPDVLPETPQKYLKAGPSTHDQLWITLHELGHAIGLEGGDVPPDSTNLAHNPGLHYRHDAAYDDPSEREPGIYWTPVGANENSVNMCGNVGTDPTQSDLPKMWDMRYYRDCLGELIRIRYGSADTRIEDLIKYTDALIVGSAGSTFDYEIVVSGEAAPVDGKMWQRETTPNGEQTVPVVAKTTRNAEVEGGRIRGTVSGDEYHGFYFSGELKSIDVDRTDDLRLWVNRYPHTLVIDGVEGKEAEYEVTVSGTLEKGGFGEALPSEDGVVDIGGEESQRVGESSATGTVTGDADGYLFTGDVKSVVVDPPEAARVAVDGEERPPDYPRTMVVNGREGGTGAKYEIQVSRGIQGYEGELPAGDGTVSVGINPSEQITDRSAEGVVIGGADGYRFSGEIESLAVAPTSEATVYVDGEERPSDYPHTLVIDGTIGGETAEYEVEVTGEIRGFEGRLPAGDGLIGTNINNAEDIGERSATGTVADYADGYVFSGQLTDITVTPPEEARVYVDGEERPVEDGNKPPTAAFELSQTPPQVDETITLDASESTDPDGSITEYQWKIYRTEDGKITPEPIATPTGRTVEFSFAEPNTYRVELTVRDDHDATATTSELVDVNAPPRPAFDIRPPHPNPGDAVTFDASASTDPDGEPIRHKWEFFEKPAQNRIATMINETVTRTFSGGTYAVRLTVTDDEGASATTTSTLEVGNLPPTADFDANPPDPTFNQGVVFDGGRSSDPDGSIASYDWEILKRDEDGSKSTTVKTGTGKLLSHRFEDTGPHTVRLTVTDDHGATDTKSVDYDIILGGSPTAKIRAPDEPIPAGKPVTFSGAPSESAAEIVEYEWRAGPDIGEWTAFGAQETFTHTFPESGRYAVQLTVYNDNNVSATREIGVMVGEAPVAQFEVTPDTTLAPNEEVTFDASASRDPDGSITDYRWKFFRKPSGNPETATGRTVTRSFDVGIYAVTLEVTDDKGLSAGTTKTINVSTPPVARFDTVPDSPEPGEEVTFDAGRSNDPDGSIASYEWTFQEQPFQNRETATGERVTKTFPEGSHAVTLTVTDDDGVTDTVSKTLNVAAPPRSPVARFDVLPSTPSPGEKVTLDASSSTDPDGSITEYRWRVYRATGGIIDPDPVVTLNGQSVTHTFSDTATYTVELTVTDESEKTDTSSTTIIPRAPPEATFALRPSKPTPGEEVTFDASGSRDPDGSITSYEWTFQEQPFQNRETASGERVTRTFSEGEYAVTLTVTDDTGATDTVSRTVIVSATPEPPVARLDVSPNPPTQDEEVTFDASASGDPDEIITEYQWQVFHTGGNVLEPDPIATLSGRSVTYTFPDPSTYTVELNVTDSSGKTDTASTVVSVNTAPSSAFIMRPPRATPGEEVTFDASGSSDPDGSITSYEWTFQEQPFQNRETASGVRVTRTFSEGEYAVTLTVTDDDGATDTKSETLVVKSVNQPPTASIDGPVGTVYTGVTVEFDGSGSEDPDGTITSYEWTIDPPTGEPVTRSGATVSYSVTDQGLHQVELTVSDDEGATDTARMSFTVEETPLRPL